MKAAATLFDPHVPSLWYTYVCTFIRACVHLFACAYACMVRVCVVVCMCVCCVCCVLCVV